MLDKKYFAELRAKLLNYSAYRRELIKIAGDAQQASKKAIFALQRGDNKAAAALLADAEAIFEQAGAIIKKDQALKNEGSYHAALEEYAEAEIFRQCLADKSVGRIDRPQVEADIYVSGLCDVPGELYRYAIKSATEKDFEWVKSCHAIAEEIIGELVDMNLTGYNRQKFDQAKQALLKLEQVVYEVNLKRL